MTETPIKKINKIKNKTRRKNNKLIKSMSNLTPYQKSIICKTSLNTYNTFEDKVEEVFKKNKVDIVSTGFNLEKQIVQDLKKAVSPSKITPNNAKLFLLKLQFLNKYIR